MNEPAVRFSVVVPAVNEEKLIERMLRQFTPEIVSRYCRGSDRQRRREQRQDPGYCRCACSPGGAE